MAKGSGTTRSVGSGAASAPRTTTSSAGSRFETAGFRTAGNGYEFSSGGASIELREYIPSTGYYQGQKRFDFIVRGEDGMRKGDLSSEKTENLLAKFSTMSASEKESAINSYIRDLFNPRITRSEADAIALRKKYLGI